MVTIVSMPFIGIDFKLLYSTFREVHAQQMKIRPWTDMRNDGGIG